MSKQAQASTKRLYASYFTGFGISLALTLAAFALATLYIDSNGDAYPKLVTVGMLLGLAVMQLIAQLVFFFHLGREPKPRLNTISFLFMLMVVGIIGLGSIWIMYNLNYNMTEQEVETFIQQEENIYPEKQESHNH
jgi:cytochrome o ubiquinol oxidase operon protein cyoD